jgi:hypothetical protein
MSDCRERPRGDVRLRGRRCAAVHGRRWREVCQLMVGTFDASGHESNKPFLVVAGFVSSAGDWDDFSQLWLEQIPVYVPLQASDWLAYESFRLLKLGSDDRGTAGVGRCVNSSTVCEAN